MSDRKDSNSNSWIPWAIVLVILILWGLNTGVIDLSRFSSSSNYWGNDYNSGTVHYGYPPVHTRRKVVHKRNHRCRNTQRVKHVRYRNGSVRRFRWVECR